MTSLWRYYNFKNFAHLIPGQSYHCASPEGEKNQDMSPCVIRMGKASRENKCEIRGLYGLQLHPQLGIGSSKPRPAAADLYNSSGWYSSSRPH